MVAWLLLTSSQSAMAVGKQTQRKLATPARSGGVSVSEVWQPLHPESLTQQVKDFNQRNCRSRGSSLCLGPLKFPFFSCLSITAKTLGTSPWELIPEVTNLLIDPQSPGGPTNHLVFLPLISSILSGSFRASKNFEHYLKTLHGRES